MVGDPGIWLGTDSGCCRALILNDFGASKILLIRKSTEIPLKSTEFGAFNAVNIPAT